MSWKKVVVFLGSTRDKRVGERVATFVCNQLKAKDLEVTLVDPLKFELPLLTKPLHWYSPTDKPQPPQHLVDMNKKIKESDAILVVSAEYNHSIPPALSNTMDYFGPSSYAMKPSGIITYSPGAIGGARAGVQLRSLLGELGCISVSNMFAIGGVSKCFNEDGTPTATEDGEKMVSRLDRLLKQVEWWANAAIKQRACKESF